MSERGSEEAPSSRRRWGWFLVGVILLVVSSITAAVYLRDYFTVPEVVLADLTGMRHDEATAVLRRQGLDPVTFIEHVSSLPKDTVTSQAPEPGAIVKRGRSISLGVNAPPSEALVPDLVGQTQTDAERRAVDLNLPLATISFQPSNEPPGRVIGQAPPPGEALGEGRQLELTVSSGIERGSQLLPDLRGVKLEDAQVQLHALGFRLVESVPSSVSFSEPGTVVSSTPPAGEGAPLSTPVVLHYSIPTSSAVRVPDVVGLPEWRAQLALRAAQLLVGQVTYVQDPAAPPGVVEVKPTGYTLPGTPILLTVNGEATQGLLTGVQGQLGTSAGESRGVLEEDDQRETSGSAGSITVQLPPDGSRQVPFTFDPTHMGVRGLLESAYHLRVVVEDERGERDVIDAELGPGEVVTTTIAIYGDDVMLQTYINDVFFQAWRP